MSLSKPTGVRIHHATESRRFSRCFSRHFRWKFIFVDGCRKRRVILLLEKQDLLVKLEAAESRDCIVSATDHVVVEIISLDESNQRFWVILRERQV